jgi:hypothetical protein
LGEATAGLSREGEGRDAIIYRAVPDDRPGQAVVAVELHLAGLPAASMCHVVALRIHVGAAVVRMDGIGEVGTHPEYRQRGYSRRVLSAAVEKMIAGDAALSMLYGIPDFYHKFGYATAGPEYALSLPSSGGAAHMPLGWSSRPLAPGDVEAVRALYTQNTARAVGAGVRAPAAFPWTMLSRVHAGTDECRVVVAPDGRVAAYAWRGAEFWFYGEVAGAHPDDLVLGEVMADGPAAADAMLALCRGWAADEALKGQRRVARVTLMLPPDGPVAAAAMYQHATFRQSYVARGDSMARVLHVGRLLTALAPELSERLRAGDPTFRGVVRFETDIGAASLAVTPDGVAVEGAAAPAGTPPIVVRLPQTALARLVLGAFPPGDLLSRLETPPSGQARHLLEIMFPRRHPYMFAPDRY